MICKTAAFTFATAALAMTGAAHARELATVERIDSASVRLLREDAALVTVWLSVDTVLDKADRKVASKVSKGPLTVALPASARQYLILQPKRGPAIVVSERRLPLEQGSNFRDIGGYVTKDGRTVRWGKAFRSGAMPLFTEADYALIGGLGVDAVVDLRSQEERQLTADTIDDRTGALFLSNDYSMKTLMTGFGDGGGENLYKGMETLLAPQLRSLYRRIMADDGAVIYHCSAGQDRTGIATALLYDLLGVDRETILKDYHLSTQWRDPQWEMPVFDPKDHADNPLVQMYASTPKDQQRKAQPLFTRSGNSHLAQFFIHLDATYGGTEGYMKQKLGFTDGQLLKLRETMLD
jgi:protein-tyrosine phosphatase